MLPKKQLRYIVYALFIAIISICVPACTADKGKNIPDVSNIKVDLKIDRFEQDLQAISAAPTLEKLQELNTKYPVFYPEVFKVIMSPQPDKPVDDSYVLQLIQEPIIQKLQDTCSVVFNDISEIEKELTSVFQFYKYHFPDKNIPKVVSYISEFSLGTFTFEDELVGIGMDFFLGKDFPGYHQLFPNYISRTMNKEHLVATVVKTIASGLVDEPSGSRLLDLMIHNGKKLYVTDQLLPYAPDSLKMGYTQQEIEWVDANEMQLWAHLAHNDLLYSTKMRDIQKLINHSPHGTSDMPPEAPGRAANWVGWQIVKRYMERFPNTNLTELIELKDAQLILDKGKYKPT